MYKITILEISQTVASLLTININDTEFPKS